jgi:hypothetical protein
MLISFSPRTVDSAEGDTMGWSFAGFGMHVTVFPAGLLLLLTGLVVVGLTAFGSWALLKFLLATAR